MGRLTNLANKFGTDKGTKKGERHGFTEFYDPYWEKYIGKEDLTILEIGIEHGGSLRAINEYFDHMCQIYAIDINDDALSGFDNNIHTFHCNQGSQEEIMDFLTKIGNLKFDIIIDDGSHRLDDQMVSLYCLKDSVKEGGIYVLEDLHTSLVWGQPDDSPLSFLTGNETLSWLPENMTSEISNQIDTVTLFLRHNPYGLFSKSITSIIKFK